MAKAGEKVTDAQGRTWVSTQGGNWRLYENGKATSTVSKTNPAGTGSAAPSIGQAATTPVTNENTVAAPTKLSPQGVEFLKIVKDQLQQQVTSGGINQAQADQEYARRSQQVATLPPALQKAQLDLQGQVNAGGINQATADNELYRQQGLADTTNPQPDKNVPLDTASDVIKATSDVARNVTPQGQLLTNANQSNPFGSQTVTIDPVTGQPIVNQSLSQGNQNVVNATQGTAVNASGALNGILGQNGQGGALQSAVSAAGPQSGPSQQLIDSIYGQLTQRTDKQYAQDRAKAESTLANRGIPVGSEAYNNQMEQLNAQYDSIKSNAQNQAVQNAYGTSISQQGANTASLGAISGAVSPLSSLQSSGYYNPNLQGFQSVAYQQPNVGEVFNTLTGEKVAAANNAAGIEQSKISAGATLGAAGIAADASKSNAATAASVASQPKPGSAGFLPGAPP